MQQLWLFPVLAIVVEALTEYIKNVVRMTDKKTVIVQMCALALSVLICVAARADLFAVLGIEFHIPLIGSILTGVFASRGANYMSDLLTRLQGGKNTD